uniref:AHD domain-containing protein n=1 Tax=Caenorhabditis tropicalis TaxID=1561998 RepID=A0A1I7USY2_9PELO
MHIVEVLIGHSSTKLAQPWENGHTHKWTLFVKPANKKYEDFPDTKLIQKVKFEIHQTYVQPVRVVTKPPFRISETGFASFTTVVTIYLNLPNEMERKIPYELKLFTGEHDIQWETQKLALKTENVPAWYLEQMRIYEKPKKRKASMISSSNDEKSPREHKKAPPPPPVKSDHDKYKSDKESSSKSKKSKEIPKIQIEKPSDSRKEKKKYEEVEKVKSPEELTKRLNECSDSYVIYKASEFLLTLPDTKLSSSTLQLTFDLSKCNSDTLLEIGKILKMKKSK